MWVLGLWCCGWRGSRGRTSLRGGSSGWSASQDGQRLRPDYLGLDVRNVGRLDPSALRIACWAKAPMAIFYAVVSAGAADGRVRVDSVDGCW